MWQGSRYLHPYLMADISNKAKEMYEKYNALSVSNKKKFMLYIEPLIRAHGTQGFMNERNACGENRSAHRKQKRIFIKHTSLFHQDETKCSS